MPAKVCMFVYNNFLHDTRVLKEARTLVANGYDVTVIAMLDNASMPIEVQCGIRIIRVKNPIQYCISRMKFTFLHIKKGLLKFVSGDAAKQRHQCIKSGNDANIVQKKYSGEEKILARGNPLVNNVVNQRLNGLIMAFYKAFCLVDYYIRGCRVAINNPATIYHANDLNTLPVAWFVAKRCGAKLVYDSHELYVEKNMLRPPGRMIKFLLSLLEAFLIRKANAVITVNESIADELSRRYRIKTPTVVMNAPSLANKPVKRNANLLREALHVNSDYRLLLYLGLITFNRGLEKMIESLIYLPDCYLVLMGYGTDEYKKQLLEVAQRNRIESRVTFFGPVPPDEVIMYAAGADLGVAPIENSCLSYYYCSPNKVFEYINAGLAVIASDFPELRRVIYQHHIGCTFDPGDPGDIARAVSYVLEDAERWYRMKQNTLAASQCYNWENESKKLLNLYKLFR